MKTPTTPRAQRAPLLHRLLMLLAFTAALSLSACGSDDGGDGKGAPSDAASVDGGATDGTSGDDGSAAEDGGADAAAAEDGLSEDGQSAGDAMSDAGATGDAGTTADATAPAPRPFTPHKIAIAGVWESNFGGNETITDKAWATTYGASQVIKFDNDKGVVYTQNAKDDKYNPSKFNKIMWTAPKQSAADGFQVWSMYYCTVDFGLDSLAMAEASTKTADSTDPAKGGCGTFPWTQLTALETVGEWKTNFGGTETINRQAWSYAWVKAFENKKNVAYTKNPADAKYNPGKWNKLVWASPKSGDKAGKWYYCTVDFGLDSLDAAKKSAKKADDKDLTGKGCGGFSWTEMTAK